LDGMAALRGLFMWGFDFKYNRNVVEYWF
jgi:hypothetical protein